MKILSWNINGIRAIAKKGFQETIRKLDPDIICLQETRINSDTDIVSLTGYTALFVHSNLAGRNGMAVYYKNDLQVPCYQIKANALFENEGRVQLLLIGDVLLINAYFPSSKGTRDGLSHRVAWNVAFNKYVKLLRDQYPLILCGDLNVARGRLDMPLVPASVYSPGCTPEEHALAEALFREGMVDIWRAMNPTSAQYTWWSNYGNARSRNIGYRLDYFLVDARLLKRVRSITILSDIAGSDHCPLMLMISTT